MSEKLLSPEQQEFKKQLEEMADNRYTLRDVFDDYLLMASVALRQVVTKLRKGSIDMELEKATMDYLNKRYKKPQKFGYAHGVLVMALEKRPHDFLGEFYQAIQASNSKSGQFFTPSPVAAVMARMTLRKKLFQKVISKGRRVRIDEPACGAGCMVIEMFNVIKKWGTVGPEDFVVRATDIDLRCVRMCYIQLTMLDIPAVVVHGNTLSLETWETWPTLSYVMRPWGPLGKKKHKPSADVRQRSRQPKARERHRTTVRVRERQRIHFRKR